MLGAVAAYLCIGIAFALIYQAIGAIQASPFFGHRVTDRSATTCSSAS